MAKQHKEGTRVNDADEDLEESSASDWDGDHWDNIESAALDALEQKLDSLCPKQERTTECKADEPSRVMVSLDAKTNGRSSSAGSNESPTQSLQTGGLSHVDTVKLLEEACKNEPYNPEDHFLTAEEMWGSASDEDDDKDHDDAGNECDKQTGGPTRVDRQPAQPDGQRSVSMPSVPGQQPSSKMSPEQQLQQVCMTEQYRPEDHILTAEEMWGSSDEGDEAKDDTCSPSQDLKQQELQCANVTQGGSSYIATLATAQPSSVTANQLLPSAAEKVDAANDLVDKSGSGGDMSAVRLQRILAGSDAEPILGHLNMCELDAVADDCERALETLRWVTKQQRKLSTARGAG